MSLEETKHQLLLANETAENLLTKINEIYIKEINSEEPFLNKALSELHNSGKINFIESVKKIDQNTCGYDFFVILNTFEVSLPTLEVSVEDVLHCLAHLKKQVGRDSAFSGVFRSFQEFCSFKAERPKDSLTFILKQQKPNDYIYFIPNAILALHSYNITEAINYLKKLSTHENTIVREQVYFCLGQINITKNQADKIWEILRSSAIKEQANSCKAFLLRGILNFGEKLPSHWKKVEELITTFINDAPPELQYEISSILAFQRLEFPDNVFNILLNQLANIHPEHKSIISNIDRILVKLIERDSTHYAIKLLEWSLAAGVKINLLGYFSTELLSNHQKLLDHIVTKWFLSSDLSLCLAILELLNGLTDNVELKADTSLICDDNRQIFVCHKAIGWLFIKPVEATSFILSIYDIANLNIRKELERNLFDPLFLSYPRDLKKYLYLCIKNKNQAELCKRLLSQQESYYQDLEIISDLKELRAPIENIKVYQKNFDKTFQQAQENAPKAFFEELCTVQNLLYGNSSIYYMHQTEGEPIRQETEMLSFSHSNEIPRLTVLDPENLNRKMRVYRCEKLI